MHDSCRKKVNQQEIEDMKPIGKDEKGNSIFDELNCDVCGIMTGPRTLYDDCLNCGATKTERIVAGRKGIADMRLSVYKKVLLAQAEDIKERFGFDVDITVEYRIMETAEATKKVLDSRRKIEA